MKKLIKYIIVISFFTLALISCEVNETPVIPPPPDCLSIDSIVFVDTTKDVQKVLIQDFTGHKCGNCPKAHIKMEELVEEYGDNIIPMVIHYGYFAQTSNDFTRDFTTTTGDEIGDYHGVQYTPIGTVNQTSYNGDFLISHENWENAYEILASDLPKVDLDVINVFNEEKQIICSYAQIEVLKNLEGNYSIAIYIIEDDIIAPQLDYSADPNEVEDYEHMHVFRGALNNSTWGENIITTSEEAGITMTTSLSSEWNGAWNADNCHTITVLLNDDTKEIVQVEMTPVKE